MTVPREELQRRLAKLEASLPALMAANSDAGHFNQAFADLADGLDEHAPLADDAWVYEQIGSILQRQGLWRSDFEQLPPARRQAT